MIGRITFKTVFEKWSAIGTTSQSSRSGIPIWDDVERLSQNSVGTTSTSSLINHCCEQKDKLGTTWKSSLPKFVRLAVLRRPLEVVPTNFRPARSAAFLLVLFVAFQARSEADSQIKNLHGIAATPFSGVPLFFEPDHDASPTRFLARGRNHQFLILPTEAQLVLRKSDVPSTAAPHSRIEIPETPAIFIQKLRLSFPGANANASIRGDEQMAGKMNYFIGNNRSEWRSKVSIYGKVRVTDLYPGIDLVYYGNQQQLEYDFTVFPGADPSTLAIQFQGADKLSVASNGELVIALGDGEIRQPPPTLYQLDGGTKKFVEGHYELRNSRTVAFRVGVYNRDLPLVIDPILSYSTYFGGNAADAALSVKVNASDTNGYIYVVGQTLSTQFPFLIPSGAYQTNFRGGTVNGDAFVAKLSNSGTNLIYFTYLGGSGNESAFDLAVDSAGNAYITGFTDSTNFPIAYALYPQIAGSPDPTFHTFPTDAFVTELNPDGSALVYSTYLGGTAMDVGGGIALDPAGNTYVTGYTYSTNFPTTISCGCNPLHGSNDVFVTKIAADGQSLLYSTYLGGTNIDEGQGIAADGAGFAYVTGYTLSTNFPTTTNALRRVLNGSSTRTAFLDAFVAKIDTSNASQIGPASLVYSTLLGGSNNDSGFRITLDSNGDAYITGNSQSPDFPKTVAFPSFNVGITSANINSDVFLSKVSFGSAGMAIIYSVQFGGSRDDVGWDVAVDPAGNAYVVGVTSSTNFPTTTNLSGFLRHTNSGASDVFVFALSNNASSVLYSAYLGGSADDFGYGIAVDPAGNAYVAGRTFSGNFPTVPALTGGTPFQAALHGNNDAFLAKISSTEQIVGAQAVGSNVLLRWPAFSSDYTLEIATNLDPPVIWTAVSAPSVVSNGYHTVTLPATNSSSIFRLRRQ